MSPSADSPTDSTVSGSDPSLASISLSTKLQFLPGVGPARATRLAKLGLRNVRDVLFFLPRNYERPATSVEVDHITDAAPVSLVGRISDAELVSRRPGRSLFAAIVENDSGAVRILFFNQPFRADQLTLDRRVMISGMAKLNGLRWEFTHPKVVTLESDEDVPSPRMLPIYPLTEGVKQSDLRQLTATVTGAAGDLLAEVLPADLRAVAAAAMRESGINLVGDLPGIASAVRQIHAPENERSLLAARARLVFQELFVLQLALAMRRRQLTTQLRSPPVETSAMVDARICRRFPFELTNDQRRAIDDIRGDLRRQFPMNRLVQGDVGSGKTIVAVYAMMATVAGGHQAVLMAPTEVLARQHFDTISSILTGSSVRVSLLCGSLSAADRRDVIGRTAAGEIDVLVGTQALVYGDLSFASLGLCVIDEQHKFGVRQRAKLRGGGVDPHCLVMSATPIPRSLAMTLFGDVDLSTIREKPPGRAGVRTYLGRDHWRDRWWAFVRERLDEGRQAFVVAPRVAANDCEGDDGEDVSSVETVFAQLRSDQLRGYSVELLHGRMPADQKGDVMRRFAEGRVQVLVSTTVIEVGIDVPEATVMTILGAERFGLAQLHQIRGRVARGHHVGHVSVFTDGDGSPEDHERLQIFAKTDDGFELAEADFRLRGPGELIGRSQSGLPRLRIADLNRDVDFIIAARRLAQEMIDENPDLAGDDLVGLKRQVIRRYGRQMELADAV